jgi:hypothetical protein
LRARPFEALARASGVALVGGLALLLGAGRAQAYCRAVTASPPSGYDPTTLGCFTGDDGSSLPGLYWRNWCTGYSLQKNASRQISLPDARAVAAKAFAAWQAVQCPDVVVNGVDTGGGPPAIFVSELQPVDCDAVPSQEHNNPIIFRDDGWPYTDTANAIGYTTLTVDLTTGEILGAAIEINTSTYTIVAQGPAPAGAYDLPTVLTHEAGHFLGLAHSDHRDAVMFALYQPNSTTISPDDVQGICDIYSSTGARNTAMGMFAATSCNPEPRLGFLDECGSIDSGIVSSGTGPSNQGSSVGSGATTQAASDDGGKTSDAETISDDGGASTETLFGCTVSRAMRPGPWSRGPVGFAFIALLVRRTRRARRRSAWPAA